MATPADAELEQAQVVAECAEIDALAEGEGKQAGCSHQPRRQAAEPGMVDTGDRAMGSEPTSNFKRGAFMRLHANGQRTHAAHQQPQASNGDNLAPR